MSMQQQRTIDDVTLRGTTYLQGHIADMQGNNLTPVENLFGGGGGSVETVTGEHRLPDGFSGTVLVNEPTAAGSPALEIGLPTVPGRRIRVIFLQELDTANININLMTVLTNTPNTTAAQREVMQGVVRTLNVATPIHQVNAARGFTIAGSGTSAARVKVGDWIEFVDTGTVWSLFGFLRSNASAVLTNFTA